jgi:hypothetical protein
MTELKDHVGVTFWPWQKQWSGLDVEPGVLGEHPGSRVVADVCLMVFDGVRFFVQLFQEFDIICFVCSPIHVIQPPTCRPPPTRAAGPNPHSDLIAPVIPHYSST